MLVIKGWNKLLGDTFLDGRFIFSNFEEEPTLLGFWFKDLEQAGGVWVHIERTARFDNEKNIPMYTIKYPNCTLHRIGVDWFSDIDNARWTFETALKDAIR